MTYNTEITIDGAIINIDIDFEYFKEDGEVTIRINSIKNGSLEISELIPSSDIENLNWKCQKHYEQTSFDYWEQRYEERNSGLARD
jgi:hypothetical protein